MLSDDQPEVFAELPESVIRADAYGLRPYGADRFDTIIDIGANVGLFAVYARCMQPVAKIISLEPCRRTFELLQRNTAGLDIDCRRMALSADGKPVFVWHGPTSLQSRCYPVALRGSEQVESTTLAQLVAMAPDPACAMVKIDIEGGERMLVGDAAAEAAIRSVGHLGIELHFQAGAEDDSGPGFYETWINGFADSHFIRWTDVRDDVGHRIAVLTKRL